MSASNPTAQSQQPFTHYYTRDTPMIVEHRIYPVVDFGQFDTCPTTGRKSHGLLRSSTWNFELERGPTFGVIDKLVKLVFRRNKGSGKERQ